MAAVPHRRQLKFDDKLSLTRQRFRSSSVASQSKAETVTAGTRHIYFSTIKAYGLSFPPSVQIHAKHDRLYDPLPTRGRGFAKSCACSG